MKTKLLHASGTRSYVLVLDTGDEVIGALRDFAAREELSAAHFTGIGAFSEAALGFFDWQRKDYRRNPVGEQVEVVSLVGDITAGEKRGAVPTVHAHVVLGRADGTALGGHLLAAKVRPTLEIMLTESPAHLRRRRDPVSGLALIAIDQESK